MKLIHIVIIIALVCRLIPTGCAFVFAYAFGTVAQCRECNVQRHERRFPQTRLALSIPNTCKSKSGKHTTFCKMALLNDVISSFPENLQIPFASFNHTKFNEAMQEQYGCTLSYCSIKIGSSLDELAHGEIVDAESVDTFSKYNSVEDIEPFRERLIDLSFLDDLKTENEPFFPNQIFVRNNMRKIFGLYLNDVGTVEPRERPTALIGSPGVGKSVLFFLAAMYRCSQETNNDDVNTSIYFRWAGSEEDISVFIIFRDEDQDDGERKVHVLFNRSLDEDNVNSLSELNVFIRTHLNIQRRNYFAFVDGPNHSEKHKTLHGTYDYFCTSGGIPEFKNEQFNSRRWILNGWTKDESLQALITLHVCQDTPPAEGAARSKKDTASEMDDELQDVLDKAHRAYWLCGGRIRDLCKAYSDFEGVKMNIVRSLNQFNTQKIILAGWGSELGKDENLDLRIMFRDEQFGSDEVMLPFLVVDSRFKLTDLANRVDVDKWVSAYDLVKSACHRNIQVGFFTMALHKWIQTNGTVETKKTSPIHSVCMSEGKATEGIGTLTERNMYWVPSIDNFSNIDSAIVIDNNLHVFQMTIQREHDFNPATFIENFALPVWEMLRFNAVFIHIVTPLDNKVAFDYKDFTEKQLVKKFALTDTEPPEEHDRNYFDIDFEPLSATVDMTSVDTLGRSMTFLLETLNENRTVGPKHANITDRVKRWLLVQAEIKMVSQAA
jgi:hypothetical protein